MLNLFGEMIRAAKSQRQEAVQTNIFTAVLSALRGLTDHKGSFSQEDAKKAATDLVLVNLFFFTFLLYVSYIWSPPSLSELTLMLQISYPLINNKLYE